MEKIIPTEIRSILEKLEEYRFKGGQPLNEKDKNKLDTFLCSLETAIINPVNNKQVLVNPIPNEPDLTITREETMIDRIRHINSVSARVREMENPTTQDQIAEFESMDMDALDDHPVPKSIFQVADHEIVSMEVDSLSPNDPSLQEKPNPDIAPSSEADVIPAQADSETPTPGSEQ